MALVTGSGAWLKPYLLTQLQTQQRNVDFPLTGHYLQVLTTVSARRQLTVCDGAHSIPAVLSPTAAQALDDDPYDTCVTTHNLTGHVLTPLEATLLPELSSRTSPSVTLLLRRVAVFADRVRQRPVIAPPGVCEDIAVLQVLRSHVAHLLAGFCTPSSLKRARRDEGLWRGAGCRGRLADGFADDGEHGEAELNAMLDDCSFPPNALARVEHIANGHGLPVAQVPSLPPPPEPVDRVANGSVAADPPAPVVQVAGAFLSESDPMQDINDETADDVPFGQTMPDVLEGDIMEHDADNVTNDADNHTNDSGDHVDHQAENQANDTAAPANVAANGHADHADDDTESIAGDADAPTKAPADECPGANAVAEEDASRNVAQPVEQNDAQGDGSDILVDNIDETQEQDFPQTQHFQVDDDIDFDIDDDDDCEDNNNDSDERMNEINYANSDGDDENKHGADGPACQNQETPRARRKNMLRAETCGDKVSPAKKPSPLLEENDVAAVINVTSLPQLASAVAEPVRVVEIADVAVVESAPAGLTGALPDVSEGVQNTSAQEPEARRDKQKALPKGPKRERNGQNMESNFKNRSPIRQSNLASLQRLREHMLACCPPMRTNVKCAPKVRNKPVGLRSRGSVSRRATVDLVDFHGQSSMAPPKSVVEDVTKDGGDDTVAEKTSVVEGTPRTRRRAAAEKESSEKAGDELVATRASKRTKANADKGNADKAIAKPSSGKSITKDSGRATRSRTRQGAKNVEADDVKGASTEKEPVADEGEEEEEEEAADEEGDKDKEDEENEEEDDVKDKDTAMENADEDSGKGDAMEISKPDEENAEDDTGKEDDDKEEESAVKKGGKTKKPSPKTEGKDKEKDEGTAEEKGTDDSPKAESKKMDIDSSDPRIQEALKKVDEEMNLLRRVRKAVDKNPISFALMPHIFLPSDDDEEPGYDKLTDPVLKASGDVANVGATREEEKKGGRTVSVPESAPM